MRLLKTSIFLFTCFIYSTCYEATTARVSISIPANVANIYVAVCEDSISLDNLLEKLIFKPTTEISIDVPAGHNRYIWVVTTDRNDVITRVGISGSGSYSPGEVDKLNMSINNIVYNPISMSPGAGYTSVSWNEPQWHELFQVKRFDPGPNVLLDMGIVYEGSDSQFYDSSGADHYKLRLYSEIFDLYSDWH